MKICHGSDWHGVWRRAPIADMYVFTGDMLKNYPLFKWQNSSLHRHIDPDVEAKMQKQWLEDERSKGGLRRWLENPGAQVVIVRGNHDFVDIGPYFEGDVWEVDEDPSRVLEWRGLRIGGVRGINYIEGEWSDEIPVFEWPARMDVVPLNLDVLVTHAPPQMILDYEGDHYGVKAIRSYVDRRSYDDRPLLHMFGHVHAANGTRTEGHLRFSNAALGQRVIVID